MIFIYLFLLHFIADFVLQPREMGRSKSSHMGYLSAHIAIQMLVFFFGLWPFFGPQIAFAIAFSNGVIHGLIDAFIWKGYAASVWMRRKNKNMSKKELKLTWKYYDDHYFYLSIGLDQFLHMSTIVLVWSLIV